MSEQTATAYAGDQEQADIQPFDLSDEDLVKKLRGWFREDAAHKAQHADKRKLAHRMYANDQWEQTDRTVSNAPGSKKPLLTLNYLLSIVSAVEGEERTNRQEMKFYGEGQEDDGAARPEPHPEMDHAPVRRRVRAVAPVSRKADCRRRLDRPRGRLFRGPGRQDQARLR
jgi:hypothetical protein